MSLELGVGRAILKDERLSFAEDNPLFESLRQGFTSHPASTGPFIISYDHTVAVDFTGEKILIDHARDQKLYLQLEYAGKDEAEKVRVIALNTSLQLAWLASQRYLRYFTLSIDHDTNSVRLELKPENSLAFDEDNPAFKELQEVLNKLHDGHKIQLVSTQSNINLAQSKKLVDFLAKKAIGCHLSFQMPNLRTVKKTNSYLHNYYLHSLRKKKVNLKALSAVGALVQADPLADKKIRRAKQMLNRGQKIRTHAAHQHHHQRHQALQKVRSQQKQQQNQREAFRQRQIMIAQQQERMHKRHAQRASTDLGTLISEKNLTILVTSKLTLAEIETVWKRLVGDHARKVVDPENRITHVPLTTMRLILENREQFSYSVDLDDLPNGFGFMIKSDTPIDSDADGSVGGKKSILYYDKKQEKSAEERTESPLAARLEDKELAPRIGTVGQFYPFFSTEDKPEYETFVTKNTSDFDCVFNPKKYGSCKKRITSLINLLLLDDPELISKQDMINAQLGGFSHDNLTGLSTILLEKGSADVVNLLNKIDTLPEPRKTHFKKRFLDSSTDWRKLVETETLRKGELNAFQAIEYLSNMPHLENSWWTTLSDQHLSVNGTASLVDLVNAHRYFFSEVKKIHPELVLPLTCPMKNSNNMKTAYSRLLQLLRKAVNPQEQACHLTDLDFSMQGFICSGTRRGPYVLITKDMELTPEKEVLDWNKYSYLEKKTLQDKALTFVDYLNNSLLIKGMSRPIVHDPKKTGYSQTGLFTDYSQKLKHYRLIEGKLQAAEEPDKAVQDAFLKTLKDRIAYKIHFADLITSSKEMNQLTSLLPLFYRYIGEQPYAASYETYQKMVDILKESLLDEGMKKNVLPLLAGASTGLRAMQQESDLAEQCTTLINVIHDHKKDFVITGTRKDYLWSTGKEFPDLLQKNRIYLLEETPYNDYKWTCKFIDIFGNIQTVKVEIVLKGRKGRKGRNARLNYDNTIDYLTEQGYLHQPPLLDSFTPFFESGISPSLDDLTTILSLTRNRNLIRKIHQATQIETEEGTLFSLLNQVKSQKPSEDQLNHLMDFIITLNEASTPAYRELLIAIARLTDKEDWAFLPELIKIPLEEPHISDLKLTLEQIDSPASRLITKDEGALLLQKIADLPASDILDKIKELLPDLKFREDLLPRSMDSFLSILHTFAERLTAFRELTRKKCSKLHLKIQSDPGLKELPMGDSFLHLSNEYTTKIDAQIVLIQSALTDTDKLKTPESMKFVLNNLHQLAELLTSEFTPDKSITEAFRVELNTLLVQPLLEQFSAELNALVKGIHAQIDNQITHLDVAHECGLKRALSSFLGSLIKPVTTKNLSTALRYNLSMYTSIVDFLNFLSTHDSETRESLIRILHEHNYLIALDKSFPPSSLLRVFEKRKACKNLQITPPNFLLAVLKAREQGVTDKMIKTTLSHLHNDPLLTPSLAEDLLHLGLEQGHEKVQQLLLIKQKLNAVLQYDDRFFTALLRYSKKAGKEDQVVTIGTFLETNQDSLPILLPFIMRLLQQQPPDLSLLEIPFSDINPEQRTAAITILNGACWSREELLPSVKEQHNLLTKLAGIEGAFAAVAALYRQKPAPSFQSLLQKVSEEEPTLDKLNQWIKNTSLDPFGHRERILSQFQPQGIESFVSEIRTLDTGNPLGAHIQKELVHAVTYITAIGNQYPLTTKNGTQKPLSQFSPDELRDYFAQCTKNARNHCQDMKSRYEALAVLCEIMFRTTGKYPYHGQIISVLNSLVFKGNLLLQIPTGQGKSITLALMAAMNHALAGEGIYTTVCSRNQLLTERDYRESQDFYRYLSIPVALLTAGEEKNYYAPPAQATVLYTTTADKSLYDSRMKLVENTPQPTPEKQVIICDEVDAEFFDNKNAFNFSTGDEDPYVNPLEWVYPLANAFIELPLFTDERVSEQDDIVLFKHHLKTTCPEKFATMQALLTDTRLNQILNAACTAKQLEENKDFIVRKKNRVVHGKLETISVATVLVHHMEDREATLSHSVHQALHARLNILYKDKIKQYRENNTEGIPPFPCDNQIETVDSQNTNSFFKKYGRIIGATGTAGSQSELVEAQKSLGIHTMLNIPPRKRSRLSFLPDVFSDDRAGFYFGPDTHLRSIERTLRGARHQPVMISCDTIEKAEELHKNLQAAFGEKNVQVIHAINAENSQTFDERITKASTPGMITIVTPLIGRGVDIKTAPIRRKGTANPKQVRLDELAENLLVIETHLDTFRNRRQLQGRSARDGKSGSTLGIFNLADLEKQHGLNLRSASRSERIKALQKLTEKMDAEASMERYIMNRIQAISANLQACFDKKLALQHGTPEHKTTTRLKAEIIERAETIWKEVVADSDPEGKYPNPFVRYVDNTLSRAALEKMHYDYEKEIRKALLPAMKNADIEYSEPELFHFKDEHIHTDINNVSSVKNTTPVSLTDTWLAYNLNPSLYRTALEETSQLTRKMATSLLNTPDLKEVADLHLPHIATFLLPPRQTTLAAALMDSLTMVLQKKGALKDKWPDLLNVYQFLLSDTKGAKAPETPDALVLFLKERLNEFQDTLPDKDKIHVVTLQNILQEKFFTLNYVAAALDLACQQLKNPILLRQLTALRDFTQSLAGHYQCDPLTEEEKKKLRDFQNAAFLNGTQLRLQNPSYQRFHPGAKMKSEAISNLIRDKSTPTTEVLCMNTSRFGAPSNSNATSMKEYNALLKTIERVLEPNKELANYLAHLDTIKHNLMKRSNKGFFKDKSLYATKIEKLEQYINEMKSFLKKQVSTSALHHAVRNFKKRIENDPDLTRSTARFFKSNKRVTLVKEIAQATEVFLKKL